MKRQNSQIITILLAALLGAIGGGIIVALATRAIPKIMGGMMHQMRDCMQGCDCDCDSEMCKKIMND
jgi:hypothetical protein